MSAREALKTMGLSTNEVSVYLLLLQYGNQPAGVISKKAGIPRSSAQFVLESLVKKSLVSKAVKN